MGQGGTNSNAGENCVRHDTVGAAGYLAGWWMVTGRRDLGDWA